MMSPKSGLMDTLFLFLRLLALAYPGTTKGFKLNLRESVEGILLISSLSKNVLVSTIKNARNPAECFELGAVLRLACEFGRSIYTRDWWGT